MPSNPNLLNGLRAFWKLIEASGTRVDSTGLFDLSENGGTVSGTNFYPQFYDTKFAGPASSFLRASNICLNRIDASEFSITENWSVAFWVNFTAYPSTGGSTMNLVGKWFAETNGLAWGVQLGGGAGGLQVNAGYGSDSAGSQSFGKGVDGTGSTATSPSSLLPLNKWAFVAARWHQLNGLITIEISLNNGDWYASQKSGTIIAGVSRFGVGARVDSTGVVSAGVTGYMANVGVWNRRLNNYEVGDLWNGGNGLDYSFSF